MSKKKGEPASVEFGGRKVFLKAERGQHFILDRGAITKLAGEIPVGATVIEIGAGNGRLTEELAKKAKAVIAIEEDERFREELQNLAKKNKNVRIIIGDALDVDFSQFDNPWVTGNTPFHITEPLAAKTAKSRVRGATFMVGDSFASEIGATENPGGVMGKLGILVRTFFRVKRVADVDKRSFEPVPRTNATIVTLSPRGENEISADATSFLFRELFMGAKGGAKVKNALIESLIKREQKIQKQRITVSDKGTRPIMTKNNARELIAMSGLPDSLLEKPLEQLSNQELNMLYTAVKDKLQR